MVVVPLLCCHGRYRLYPANLAATGVKFEADMAIHQRIQRVVAANANARTRMELRSTLANDDVAGHDGLAAITLHTEILWIGIATVT